MLLPPYNIYKGVAMKKIPNTKCVICGKPIYRRKRGSRRSYCEECLHHGHVDGARKHARKVYNEYIVRWKEGKETGARGKYSISNHIRRYLFEKYDSKCCECGWNKVNPYTQKIPLEIEHIDGDHTNNLEGNLLLLCPNCHSLTKTYKGANKGNGRHDRLKRYHSGKSF